MRGDPHNFGRFVDASNDSDWVLKPRDCNWEFLILSKKSDLRTKLDQILNTDNTNLSSIPYLDFSQDSIISPSLSVRKIKKISNLKKLTSLSEKDFQSLGTILGLVYFFGFGDLHAENICIGRDEDMKFIFSPIDLEVSMQNYSTIEHTFIIGKSDTLPLKGISRSSIPSLTPEFLAEVINSFNSSIDILYKSRESIKKIIEKYNINNSLTSRVILKNTIDYKLVDINSSQLFKEEKIQLIRGDIPYFFKFLNKDQIYFWDKETSFKEVAFAHKENIRDFDKFLDDIDLKSSIAQIVRFASIREDFSVSKHGIKIVKKNNLTFINMNQMIFTC